MDLVPVKPIQVILPATYDETKRRKQKRNPEKDRKTQDEATRAWNIHTALYYKAGGIPWRLVRDVSQFTTCYVGVSFYKAIDNTTMQTSMAQVFNERGEGVIVRGGLAQISKEDRQAHLTESGAYTLLQKALQTYREEHFTLPARVVVHKFSSFNNDELSGFHEALTEAKISLIDLTHIGPLFTRLFRTHEYPPLRGTFLSLTDNTHLLYTRGSVPFFATYPGGYVPKMLRISCPQTSQAPLFLAQEILALTKLNWNNTQFDNALPITAEAADRVGEVLRYVSTDKAIAASYKFYM